MKKEFTWERVITWTAIIMVIAMITAIVVLGIAISNRKKEIALLEAAPPVVEYEYVGLPQVAVEPYAYTRLETDESGRPTGEIDQYIVKVVFVYPGNKFDEYRRFLDDVWEAWE